MNRPLALLFLLVAAPGLAQDRPPPLADRLDAAAKGEFGRQGLVGLAVVAIDEGKIAWMKGYGHADREAGTPVDPAATSFRWASISKPVTAIAALQLVEKGKLDLDADIRSYVPEFPDKGVTITSRNLMCHQGGIVHYTNGPVVRTERRYIEAHPFAEVIVALDNFADSPLVNRPGEKYAYTTHGYVLLSAVVERAGKQRFADQVKARIAGPLGMSDFRPDYHWEEIPNRAIGYRRQGGVVARRPADQDEDVSWKLGGGGYTSPATDLAAFGVGLIGRKLVSEKTEKLMWTACQPADPKGAEPYGLGFSVFELPGGTKRVGHTGSQEKTRTSLLLEPAAKRGVAVMSNSEWADVSKLAEILLDQIRPVP